MTARFLLDDVPVQDWPAGADDGSVSSRLMRAGGRKDGDGRHASTGSTAVR